MQFTAFEPGDFVRPARGHRLGVVVRAVRRTGDLWVIWSDDPEWVTPISRFHLREADTPPPPAFLRRLIDAYRIVADLPMWRRLIDSLQRGIHWHTYRPQLRVVPNGGTYGR
jgi:hypothetical protein